MYQNCCKKCGSISLHTEVKGNNTGLYCDDCGAWIKWLGKDELRAFEHANKSRGLRATAKVYKVYDDVISENTTIDNARKHGHWFALDECANEGVYCSVCYKKVYKLNYANQKLKSKYCPNCGAIMDEKEDS